jgi:hypothetical protein
MKRTLKKVISSTGDMYYTLFFEANNGAQWGGISMRNMKKL